MGWGKPWLTQWEGLRSFSRPAHLSPLSSLIPVFLLIFPKREGNSGWLRLRVQGSFERNWVTGPVGGEVGVIVYGERKDVGLDVVASVNGAVWQETGNTEDVHTKVTRVQDPNNMFRTVPSPLSCTKEPGKQGNGGPLSIDVGLRYETRTPVLYLDVKVVCDM